MFYCPPPISQPSHNPDVKSSERTHRHINIKPSGQDPLETQTLILWETSHWITAGTFTVSMTKTATITSMRPKYYFGVVFHTILHFNECIFCSHYIINMALHFKPSVSWINLQFCQPLCQHDSVISLSSPRATTTHPQQALKAANKQLNLTQHT